MTNYYAENIKNPKVPLEEISKFHETVSKAFEEEGLKCGISASIFCGPNLNVDVCSGFKEVATRSPMTTFTKLQVASLSKTIGSAFLLEYSKMVSWDLSGSVNELLEKIRSPYRITSPANLGTNGDDSRLWADQVTLRHLVDHTAMGMHYVFGFPTLSHPSMEDLHNNVHKDKGYSDIFVVKKKPGSSFSYSGAGFIILQHILETTTGLSIQSAMEEFLKGMNMDGFLFGADEIRGSVDNACGHFDNNEPVQDGMLLFPPLAAGGVGTPRSLANFWQNLVHAYHTPENTNGISHASARKMLDETEDKGSVDFMNARMGYGVFVLLAGPNLVACHQAANDGFRGVYLVCFDGPDSGKGIVVLTNGDNKSVLVICQILQRLLIEFRWEGVNTDKLKQNMNFDWTGIPQEQIVNQAYKNLVFSAFES